MSSFTYTETRAFTVTHARHLAAKVATDLKRMQRFYGSPSDSEIANYEAELIALLKADYLAKVSYGFRRDRNWIEPMLRYRARDLSEAVGGDDDPGKVRPGANINGASFYSYLSYNSRWLGLSSEERQRFQESLPIQRTTADEPEINGYLSHDRCYSASNRALDRSSVRGST